MRRRHVETDLVVQDVEVEREQVDGDGVLAGVVLLDAGQERLREEEPGQPEDGRRVRLEPVLEEAQARQEVVDVAAERLERRVRLLHPHARYLALPTATTRRHTRVVRQYCLLDVTGEKRHRRKPRNDAWINVQWISCRKSVSVEIAKWQNYRKYRVLSQLNALARQMSCCHLSLDAFSRARSVANAFGGRAPPARTRWGSFSAPPDPIVA